MMNRKGARQENLEPLTFVLIKQRVVMKKSGNGRSVLNFEKPSPRKRKNRGEIKYIKNITPKYQYI